MRNCYGHLMMKLIATSILSCVCLLPLAANATTYNYTCLAKDKPEILKLAISFEPLEVTFSSIKLKNSTSEKDARKSDDVIARGKTLVIQAGFTPSFQQRIYVFDPERMLLEYHLISLQFGKTDRALTTAYGCEKDPLEFKQP